jgi:hypothetical protein
VLQTIADRMQVGIKEIHQDTINHSIKRTTELKHVTCDVCNKMVKRHKSNQIMCNECESKPENSIENVLEKREEKRNISPKGKSYDWRRMYPTVPESQEFDEVGAELFYDLQDGTIKWKQLTREMKARVKPFIDLDWAGFNLIIGALT